VLDEHADGGFAAIRGRYEALFRMRGRRVRVLEMDGSETAGTAHGIDDDGALLVDRDDGERCRVIAGDVTLAKEARAG
jgi:biotin-(acetyl-CoA carboxylase) ligase